MSAHEPPRSEHRRRRSWLSPVWLVPLLAAGGLAWFGVQQWRKAGPSIEIAFTEGDGLVAGRTDVKYRGVRVGEVEALELSEDLTRVIAKVDLEKTAGELANEGTKFWVVKPKVSAAGIQGLGTIVSGAYIEAVPGQGPRRDRFQALEQPLPQEAERRGRVIYVTDDNGTTFTPGSPVFYRGVQVGAVAESLLSDDARSIRSRVIIEKPYQALVRTNSVFWNAGGLRVHLGLTGLDMSAKSLSTLIEGGIAFATPESPGPDAPNGASFSLNDKPKKEWQGWRPAIGLARQPPQSER